VKILLLDVDGVLNDHTRHANGYCGLQPDKLARLDRIVAATGCRIVLASAWRYLILSGSMTLSGFRNLLLTHGAAKETADALLDRLPKDRSADDPHDRGKLARSWLDGNPLVERAVALDDGAWPGGEDLGYEVMGIPVVRPSPRVGLTDAEALRVIEMLNA